ncbi:MAG: TylF/MycF/NovP-related O-methyltransferase [Chitinophagales bacterium]
MKNLIKKILARYGYKIAITSKRGYPDFDEQFWDIYWRAKDFSLTTIERMYALYQATNYVVANNIEGAIVECGVWKGGSVMISAATLKMLNAQREIYLYDTFEGMSEPTEKDVTFRDESAYKNWDKIKSSNSIILCYSTLDEVKKNVLSSGYSSEKFHFIKGKVEDTIPLNIPDNISILRLDTDWYASTYHELKHLFSRVVKNGVIIIDDYGYWKGAREAVDQFFKEINLKPLLHRIDHTGRIIIKTT